MTKYFTNGEFACKGRECRGLTNVGQGIDPRLLKILDSIREQLGKPVYVLSGYRCPVHNANVGGASRSQHMDGTAADITYDGINVDYLAQLAEAAGADGVGRYYSQGFVHVDTRGYDARWEE